jgi:hypothetical protein
MNLLNVISQSPSSGYLFLTKYIVVSIFVLFTAIAIINKYFYNEIIKKLAKSLIRNQVDQFKPEEKMMKTRIDDLTLEVSQLKEEIKKKESSITSLALKLTQKGELIANIKNNTQKMIENVNGNACKELMHIKKNIEDERDIEAKWDNLKTYLAEAHGDFIQRLKSNFPEITSTDLKMCIYLRMNLSSKEIARLSNLTVRGIEASRYRLRKKLNVDSSTNLTDFILNI